MVIREFEVDDANLQHLYERGVTLADLDAMLATRITVIRNKRRASGTYKFVGRGQGGRALTLVVTETPVVGRWRPITGWESTDAERRAAE